MVALLPLKVQNRLKIRKNEVKILETGGKIIKYYRTIFFRL